MSTPYERALSAIDAAHAQDPTTVTIDNTPVPYELHYAQKCTSYLSLLRPSASEPLRLAIRAQHFRRWEVPRSTYPATRSGYLIWRTAVKKRQAELVQRICVEAGYESGVAERVGGLIRKEGLKKNTGTDKEGEDTEDEEEEVQVLEDVACLVFLEERLEGFLDEVASAERKVDGVNIVRKTWAKMSRKGREVAMGMELGEGGKRVLKEALEGVE